MLSLGRAMLFRQYVFTIQREEVEDVKKEKAATGLTVVLNGFDCCSATANARIE